MNSLRKLMSRALPQSSAPASSASSLQHSPSKITEFSFQIGCPWVGGFVDLLEVDPGGILRVIGWSPSAIHSLPTPTVYLDESTVPFLQHYCLRRPDVVLPGKEDLRYTGFVFEYLVPEPMLGRASLLELELKGQSKLRFEADFSFISPDYRTLLFQREVFHRDHIYGSGLPNSAISAEVFELAEQLPGPLLDFGCGRGLLVERLRQLDKEAFGLELDNQLIRSSLNAERSAFITLYDGSFPSPFVDREFRSVFCSEVLEHIPNYQAAIEDIARIAQEKVIFTVPDASAIPIGFRHGAVPWHLMEASHVNFFNQLSFECALQPHFRKVEFARIGPSRLNGSHYHVSLVAICWK